MQQQTEYMMSKTAIRRADNTGSAKAVFYLSNHRGDTLAAYRDSSTQVATYRYDAFGNQRAACCVISDPANAPRYTFSTKEFLSSAGLYLYQYRVYDPVAGRWTQRDPIDYQDSLNLYQFCGNNGINATDADGRGAVVIIVIVVVVVGAAAGLTVKGCQASKTAEQIHREELAKRPTGHNDAEDAMRHAEASKRLSQEEGPAMAWAAGVLHEVKNVVVDGQPVDESLMDLHNNKEGRQAANEKRQVKPENLRTSPNEDAGSY